MTEIFKSGPHSIDPSQQNFQTSSTNGTFTNRTPFPLSQTWRRKSASHRFGPAFPSRSALACNTPATPRNCTSDTAPRPAGRFQLPFFLRSRNSLSSAAVSLFRPFEEARFNPLSRSSIPPTMFASTQHPTRPSKNSLSGRFGYKSQKSTALPDFGSVNRFAYSDV